ncbi:hypothetical protein EMIHUDRAFT_418514, partial [Emiliania huxleyi CCMP1516]|uniref:FAD synthase n=2 Tax=Emiliania huxleyi TaxID=2903 RepID=A0A0D3JZ98_EMIH1
MLLSLLYTLGVALAPLPLRRSRTALPRMCDQSSLSQPAQADAADAADALALHRRLKLRSEVEDEFGRALKEGLEVCAHSLRLYGPARVVTSFNGGKDAVAILHLMRAALAAHSEAAGGPRERLRVIFFEQRDEFPEVDAFVRDAVERYDLELCTYSDGFAAGLESCIAEHGSAAFVLGTREGDPNGSGQGAFEPSSTWMPPFMRVNPVLRWSYAHVWQLLRGFALPFCSLYEEGYTSLGKQSDTEPNPALRLPDGSYRPAWLLD